MIGAVLIPGAVAPKLVTREMIAGMNPGAVVVDVAIDQGGCFETSHPTTHSDPVYVVDGVTHYCVANMPGGVPITSTMALTNATLPYVEAIAGRGLVAAVEADPALARGVNVLGGPDHLRGRSAGARARVHAARRRAGRELMCVLTKLARKEPAAPGRLRARCEAERSRRARPTPAEKVGEPR